MVSDLFQLRFFSTMKFFLVLSAVFILATSSPVINIQDSERSIHTFPEDYKEDEGNLEIDVSKIKYYVYRKGSSSGAVVDSTSVSKLKNTRFDASLENIYVIHGWTNNNSSSINKSIRDALLKKYNVNIFIVDWSAYSRVDYITSAAMVPEVGKAVADFIEQTVKQFKVSLNNVRLVGFSLGAHIAGIAGKSLGGKVASITGLDPAGPGFYKAVASRRLDSGDAKYVSAIHSNSGLLGCTFSVGHSDYWPNGGGLTQPGCVTDVSGLCSHNRVFALYAESLTDNKFLARKCDSYTKYKAGSCKNAASSHMGGIHPNTGAQGNYYLDTNSKSPFGKN